MTGYTFEDYRDGVPPRGFGRETEYTTENDIETEYTKQIPRPPMHALVNPDYSVSSARQYGRSAFISTGGELYLDSFALEYATPECRTPRELVLHARAGEQIAREAAMNMASFLGTTTNLYMRSGYTKILSPDGTVLINENSMGDHENYTSQNQFSLLAPNERTAKLSSIDEAKCFCDFLALRRIIEGTGMVADGHYSITQKPDAINFRQFTGSIKHKSKKAFAQHHNRMEVRSGEQNKSDWVAEFKVALTSLILRLIEHEEYPKYLMLKDPRQAVRMLARDPLAEVEMEYDKPRRGIDILNEIVEEALELLQRYPEAPVYEEKAAYDFFKFYKDIQDTNLRDGNVQALSDRIDWAARFEFLIERYGSYDKITTSNLRAVRDDIEWDILGEQDIARRRYKKFGHTAITVPIPVPPRTRAETRVRIARQLQAESNVEAVYWHLIVPKEGDLYWLPNVLGNEVIRHTKIASAWVMHSIDEFDQF